MKVLVTGISGFIGTNLRKYLIDSGIRVIGVSRQPGTNLFSYPELFKQTAGDYNVLIHLAGVAHDTKELFIEQDYIDANMHLTVQVFEAFLKSEAKSFIFSSSVKAAASRVTDVLFEDQMEDIDDPYGKSKRSAELYLLNQKLPMDKKLFILRPCMIHGPGNKGNLNLLYKLAVSGMPYPLAAFENQRSFLSVENLCFVIRELIERTDIPSGIYNVADDSPLSTQQVFQTLSETIKKSPKLWRIDKRCVKVVAKIGDYIPLLLNSERLQKLTENYVVSNAKLLAALKKPLPVRSEDGLRKTFQSFIDIKKLVELNK